MTWILIRNAVLDGDMERVKKELSRIPKMSLVHCFNSVVNLLLLSSLPNYSRLEAMLETFLSAGMMMNVMDEFGYTPIMNATRNENWQKGTVCRLLLKFEANVNTRGSDTPYTVMSLALQQKDWPMTSLLHTKGARLGGTDQKWDSSVVSPVIAKNQFEILDILLDQFEGNRRPVPWKEIMTLCGELGREECAKQIIRSESFKHIPQDGSYCPYLWCLEFAERVGFKSILRCVIYENPRILKTGLPVSRRMQVLYKKERRFRDGVNKLSERSTLLDTRGPQYEVEVHRTVYRRPPALKKLCRSAILTHFGEDARTRIKDSPLPFPMKSYLCESTNKAVLNLDEETTVKATALQHKLPKEVYELVNHDTSQMRLFL